MQVRIEDLDVEVVALLDSGAYSNYISISWLEKHHLQERITPVVGQYIQLGGTTNKLPVLGRISLNTTIANETARLSFVVFDSGRDCIIGLESLVIHFLEVFHDKLQLLQKEYHGLNNMTPLNEIAKLFPKEPGKVVIDRADFATELKLGEEILISSGEEFLAPEEDTRDEEEKELFAVPPPPANGLTEEEILKIVPEELKGVKETYSWGEFDYSTSMQNALRSRLGTAAFTYTEWTGIKYPPVTIHLLEGAPQYLHTKARNIVERLYKPARNSINKLQTDTIIRPEDNCSYTSPIVVVPKPLQPDEPRICGDYTAMNKIIQPRCSIVPDPKKLLDTFKRYKWYGETDWIKGFHQVTLDEPSQRLLAIATPFGTFVPQFLPMGVQPASGILAHIARQIFGDLGDFVISVQDNLLIGGDTLYELYCNIIKVMERAAKYNVKLSPPKTRFGVRQVPFFGFIIGFGKYWVNPDRQAAVKAIGFPQTLKAMQQFLGLVLFISPFIPGYSQLTAPLSGLVNGKTEWRKVEEWQGQYMSVFEAIKQAVADATELHLPDLEAEWVLRTDASDIACGGTLLQKVKVGDSDTYELQPIAFTSHKFSSTAANWSVLEKELYALVFSLQKLDYYLRLRPFVAETDHSNILYLQQSLIPKLIRWKLFIHSYHLTLRHIPGKTNVVADALSRLYELVLRQAEALQLNMLQLMGNSYSDIATHQLAQMYDIDACEEHIYDLTVQHDAIPQEIWQACHVRAHGHRGAKRTYHELGRRYPDVKIPMEVVQQAVDACAICQKYKSDLYLALKTARHVLTAEHHRSQISVDVAGMEEDDAGNDTCFIIVNHNTKLVYLYAAKGKEEIHAINAVLSYIGHYGLMEKIISDPGGEFTGQFTSKLMQKLGVKWDLSITDRPQSHGTERTVGRALEAVRILMAQDVAAGSTLAWSEPAVLATTSYLLNSEINDETGFTAFDLVFGQGECKDLPDISGLTGKRKLEEYTAALQKHLDEIRQQANTRRLNRQQQRLAAGTPPGNHEYQAGDLVFIRDTAAMRSRKFAARMLGPYQVVSQDVDAGVTLSSLIDERKIVRHHNALRIFEGTLDEARKMARLDNKEVLIRCIDGFQGNVYQRAQTQWHVVWLDGTESWERYKVVENCQALTDYVKEISFLRYRYGVSGVEFKEWAQKINRLSHDSLRNGDYEFYPELDATLQNPFALSIHYFNQNQELQQTKQARVADSGYAKAVPTLFGQMRDTSMHIYLTAHVVKITKARLDVFVPALSAKPHYNKFPSKSAYVKSLTPAEIIQFATETPAQGTGNADQLIADTNFKALVWPEQWDTVGRIQADAARPLKEVEQPEEEELDEDLTDGERTGQQAYLKDRGTTHSMTIGQQFPDGDYLCTYNSTQNTVKAPSYRLAHEANRVLLRRPGRRKRGEGQ